MPQRDVLKHATAAITHAGMNSISDLLAAQVPFVCLPIGADQPALASRARELGATLVLDHATVTSQQLEEAVARVLAEPSFRAGIHAIADSFRAAGGYPRAADEVFAWKKARGLH